METNTSKQKIEGENFYFLTQEEKELIETYIKVSNENAPFYYGGSS